MASDERQLTKLLKIKLITSTHSFLNPEKDCISFSWVETIRGILVSNYTQIEFAQRVSQLCEVTAENFSHKADQIELIKAIIDGGSVLFALATAFTTLIPGLHSRIGDDLNAAIVLLAATLLVLRSSIERIILKDPASRFRDFAFYIGLYPQKIEEELVKENPNLDLVGAWVDLANSNLNDARSKWPTLVSNASTQTVAS